MAADRVQLFYFLLLLWPVAAEFPAGPGWEWVSSMVEMGGKEFGEVAEPLVKMNRNAQVYPEITPIQGWALSAKVQPLWQLEGEGPLALVYEEMVEVGAAQLPRAVIAFRGHAEGNVIDLCAFEVLYDNPEDMNTTLVSWCYATYNASTFDYYSQAVAYTMRVLESYAASSVLLCGTSMGGMVVDLAAAGVFTNYFTDLPVVAFLNMGRRRTMQALGASLQGHSTPIIGAANQWDPAIRLDWDNRIGTMCLFPTDEPSVCSACFAGSSNYSHHHHLQRELSQACQRCWSLTHDSLLLVRLMLEGRNPTCYLNMEESPLQLPLAVANQSSYHLITV